MSSIELLTVRVRLGKILSAGRQKGGLSSLALKKDEGSRGMQIQNRPRILVNVSPQASRSFLSSIL